MKSKSIYIAASLLAGFGLAISIQMNATLSSYVGMLESSFIAHFFGAILGGAILIKGFNINFLSKIKKTPPYLLTNGIFGVGIVVLSNIIIPRLGMVTSMGLLISSDLLISAIADHKSVMGLDKISLSKTRVIGLAVTMVGLIIVLWG